jgi:hypothetical protein
MSDFSQSAVAGGGTGTSVLSDITGSMQRASPSKKEHDAAELTKMQKNNFNMKLRIFYLEERLAKLAPGAVSPDLAQVEEELFQQRIMCEEKTNELEERNILLIKARNAIESLQADLELARASAEELLDDSHPALKQKNHIIDEKNKMLKQAEIMVQERDTEIRRLSGEVEELTEHANQTIEELAQAKAAGKEFEAVKEVNSRTQASLEEALSKIKILEGQIDVLRPAAESHATLSEELNAKDEKILQLSVEREDLEKIIEALKEESKQNEVIKAELEKKGEELSRLEAEEISRLEQELHQAIITAQEDRDARETTDKERKEVSATLQCTTEEMQELDKQLTICRATLKNMEEASKQRESEFAAGLSEKEATLRQEFMHKLLEKDQIVMTARGDLEKAQFALADAEKRLEGDHDDLKRSKQLVEELQQRINTMEEKSRRDEHEHLKLLESSLSAKEATELTMKKLNDQIRHAEAKSKTEVEQIRRDAHDREASLRKEFSLWERQVQANLSECFAPGSGDPSAVALEAEIDRQTREGMSATTRILNQGYPRRHVLEQLEQIKRLRVAFQDSIVFVEQKYLTKIESLTTKLASRENDLARISGNIRKLSSRVVEQSRDNAAVAMFEEERKEERKNLTHMIEERANLAANVTRLEHELLRSKSDYDLKCTKMNQLEHHLQESVISAKDVTHVQSQLRLVEEEKNRYKRLSSTAQSELDEKRRENKALKQAIDVAQQEMNILKNTQTKLHRQIEVRDSEIKRYSHEMHDSSNKKQSGFSRSHQPHEDNMVFSRNGEIDMNYRGDPGSSGKQNILRQVDTTRDFVKNDSTGHVVGSRLGMSQLSSPGASGAGEFRSVTHSLKDQQEGVRRLVSMIDELVESTGDYLEKYFATAQREAGKSFSENDDREAVGHLQRDVITLLDSNARLALQLQGLGHDLQKVYRRFKLMEAKQANGRSYR